MDSSHRYFGLDELRDEVYDSEQGSAQEVESRESGEDDGSRELLVLDKGEVREGRDHVHERNSVTTSSQIPEMYDYDCELT